MTAIWHLNWSLTSRNITHAEKLSENRLEKYNQEQKL